MSWIGLAPTARLSPAGRALLREEIYPSFAVGAHEEERFEQNVRQVLGTHAFVTTASEPIDGRAPLYLAAGAALLLRARPLWSFPAPRIVHLHPRAFDRQESGHPTVGRVTASGDIVLSARALARGWSDPHDGYNVALHELAHVLDRMDGCIDGIPGPLPPARRPAWRALVTRELAKVREGRSTLEPYAGKNAAELFAVAVEAYFERGRRLRRAHPELHAALRALFGAPSP